MVILGGWVFLMSEVPLYGLGFRATEAEQEAGPRATRRQRSAGLI